jgi:AcrR family transcriptional regulator
MGAGRRRKGAARARGAQRAQGAAPVGGNDRRRRSAGRREAILAAALDEFSSRGFAAARLEDVAVRAGVAKGTIYLYFPDKESLFQELVRAMLSPLVGAIAAAPLADLPVRKVAEALAAVLVDEIDGTRRKDVMRLVIAEGPRFPGLAAFYYHEVIARVVPVLRARLSKAFESGEISSDALARFPQLLVAPALMGIVWNGLFGSFAPLDMRKLMQAHLELLFGPGEGAP